MKSQYNTAAQQAIQHECAEEFDQAATFWRVAESFAAKPVNQQWAAMRTEFCEKRHSLEARRELWKEETKAKKKQAEATSPSMNETDGGESDE